MKRYERFSECLKRILEEEKLSASALARMLNLRSRNSIFRILSEQSSVRAQEDFLRVLESRIGTQWSSQRWQELQKALTITRIGINGYLSEEAIRQLVRPPAVPLEEIIVLSDDMKATGHAYTLREQLRALLQKGSLHITLRGCCNASVCTVLAEELAEAGHEGRVQLVQYVNVGEDVVIQHVMAIQPLMHFNWYIARQIDPEQCTKELCDLLTPGIMDVRLTDTQGMFHDYCFALYQHNAMVMVELHADKYHIARETILRSVHQLPMLQQKFPFTGSPDDYLAYTEQYRQIECDKAIYSIKPDVPINLIHTDILLPVVLDGFRESGFVHEAHMNELVEGLYHVHRMRFDNFFTKRKVTHIVFSLEAMRQFMRTGRQTDHFFAMRSYTLAERLAILHNLRDQAASNPYFFIHFLKEGTLAPMMEVTLYDGYGVMFTKANTDYNLAGEHTETLVTHPGFLRKYREFFMRELLTRYVMPHHETMLVLDELARMAVREG